MIRILFSNSGRRTYLVEYCYELIKKGYKLKLFVSDTNYVTSTFYINKKIQKLITSHISTNEKKYLSDIFRICKNKKIDLLIDGMSALSSAVKEVSDSVTHIAKMNMVSALLSENIGELLNAQTAEIRGVSKKINAK